MSSGRLPIRLAVHRRALSCQRKLLAAILGAACLLAPPASIGAQPDTVVAVEHGSRAVRAVKGRVLVQPRAGLELQELDRLLASHGGRRGEHLRQIDVHVVELPEEANLAAVTEALGRHPHVKFAEPDARLEPALVVNDPQFASQWHLPKIGAPAAWDRATGTGVTIAILDTGVDTNHPDLAPRTVPGWNTYDNSTNTADVLGHGTMVAGTAVAAGNNSLGVASVAFGARLMPIRVTDASGYAYYSTIANGLTWAADRGARVANISFQGPSASATVVSAAQYMRSKGGVVVNGAGNSGVQESYPATDYMTLVAGTDSANNVTSFSSFGSFVDVAAPATSILTTSRGGGYGSGTGTSFSGPVVAGVYALMLAANPNLTPSQLDNILFTTTTDLLTAGKDIKSGWGLVNASAAVTKAAQTTSSDVTPPTVSISSPTPGAKISGIAAVNVSAADNAGVQRTELYVNGSLYATDTTAPYAFSLDTTRLADGSNTLQARAYDAGSNSAASPVTTITVANDTVAPTVKFVSPANGSTVSGNVDISVAASDNAKVAQVSLSIDGKLVAQASGATLSHTWIGWGTKKTTYLLTATARDPAGNTATTSISVTRR